MQVRLTLRNPGNLCQLPEKVENKIIEAMTKRRFGIGMDYDRTMVGTDEVKRIFLSLLNDPARVIEPMGGLGMVGIPIGVFTGNKPSYIDTLCVRPYRVWLQEKGKVEAMHNFRVYSQNSTWMQVFNGNGEVVQGVTEKYASQYRFPPEHIQAIEDAFKDPIQRAMESRFMKESPLIIRPAGSQEEHHAYGPIFENRGGVQLSWIAVPGEIREGIIAEALHNLDENIKAAYRFEPGGQFSIDINHRNVAKNRGTVHFRRNVGFSLLLYFGDSVYKKGKYEGNDYPVVRDKKAFVFAVNPRQEEIPQHSRIIRAGIGPNATRAWLTWVLVKYISIRFATETVPTAEKITIVDAITASGLIEDVQIA